MSFYIRKSVRLGILRFNLSKSGIGVSAGVKGLRLGASPRGNYIHAGMGGIYYRKSLGKNSGSMISRNETSSKSITSDQGNHVPQEIESADTSQLVDASSEALINEIREKNKKMRFSRLFVAAYIAAIGFLFYFGKSDPFANYLTICFVVLFPIIWTRDRFSRTTVLMYDLDEEFEASYKNFYESLEKMKQAKKVWHVSAKQKLGDSKINAGATTGIVRKETGVFFKNPKYLKTNIIAPCVIVGKQALYFYPDRILVYEESKVGAVSYENLNVDLADVKFAEEDGVPSDSEVVGKTWKFVNKSGGPDKRFKNNREIPIMLYSAVHFNSENGLNELLHVSSRAISKDIQDKFLATKNILKSIKTKG